MTSLQLYSVVPARRARQIAGDVVAVIAIALSIVLGVTVGGLIGSLAALGQGIESAGDGFQRTMADAAEALGGLPLVGSGASAPFHSASEAGTALAQAGADQQRFVGTMALVVGVVVAALPILLVLVLWLGPRIRFLRRAATARALSSSAAGIELLAFRALVEASPAALLQLAADPVAAWRTGDPVMVRALALLELHRAGVRNG